jgi:hypothetical protein
VSYAPQSSPGLPWLPACLAACFLFANPLAGQQEDALTAPAELHREPEGAPLVSLPAGTPVETGEVKGGWREATVVGWVFTSSTSPTRRDGYDLVVTSDDGENLRRSPNGPILGRMREGTLLEKLSVKGKWTQVRRDGWVPRRAVATKATSESSKPAKTESALQGKAPAAPAKASPQATSAPPAKSASAGEPMVLAKQSALAAGPDGATLAMVQSGVPARVVARASGWVKVELDGWVREEDVKASDAGAEEGVTAEEVRSSPDRYVGQTVQWRVQLIAVQSADELRTEMPAGQPYLLTRGPLPEPGFVYVTIPAERVAEFRALPPLRELVLRVTIKAARTRYLNTPVAELVSVVSGMEGK